MAKEGLEGAQPSTKRLEKGSIVDLGTSPNGAGSYAIWANRGGRTKPGDETLDAVRIERVDVRDLHAPDELVRAAALLAFLDRRNGTHVEAALRWLGVPPEVCELVNPKGAA